jgi:peptidylprolyl isomerase
VTGVVAGAKSRAAVFAGLALAALVLSLAGEAAGARYFDGLAIVRVQDNYVVQWDDPDHHRPVPGGVRAAVEFTAAAGADMRFEPLPDRDAYAPQVGFLDGFPAAREPRSHIVWLAHCYGMVGAGRDDPPESDGTEMYAVIGHAPRQLDRNVALVGRVLKGVDLLSSLPRLDQRRQRHEPWFKFSPEHIDVCNVPLPVRAIPTAGR